MVINIMKRFSGFIKRIWALKLSRWLLLLSGALLIAAVVLAVCLFGEGMAAADNAQTLLQTYEQTVTAQVTIQPTSQQTDAAQTATPSPTPVMIEGFEVIGKLEIPKIEQELAVLAVTDDDALKISVCYYQGPMPDEAGNLVITGHNYASGAHFGKLGQLEEGDEVTLTMPDGIVYRYMVYGKDEIKPDDVDALNDDAGGHTLTLMTCTSHGNRRLLVRCALQQN